MLIKENQLQSIQEYSLRGNFGFRRMEPVDREEKLMVCGYCNKTEITEHERMCVKCQEEDDEANS